MVVRWAKKPEERTPRVSAQPAQFTRSRTISGYTPVSTTDLTRTSLHELHAVRRRLVRGGIAVITVIIICGVTVTQLTASTGSLSYSPAPAAAPGLGPIRAAANDYYATRPFERLRFLTNRPALGAYVASKVPEVKTVDSLGGDGIGATRMALTLRVPVASWKTGGKTVFVDSDGVAFNHDYFDDKLVEVDDGGAGVSVAASGSTVRYIGRLIALLKDNGTGVVTRAVLPAGTIRELDVYLKGRAYRVKVQLDRDVAGQAQDVKAALAYIDAHGGAGEYVDVRVEGKAYYK